MKNFYHKSVLEKILHEEKNVELTTTNLIEECHHMMAYLQNALNELKKSLLEYGFPNEEDEIEFFRKTKPLILGKLIYYNKVYKIETCCPVGNGKMYYNYFSKQLAVIKKEYVEFLCNSDFYRYYRSGRTDRDHIYFKRGNINYLEGLNSMVFEIDPEFSTFYDYKTARIIGNELLYNYLLSKINPDENPDAIFQKSHNSKDIFWTENKNALIELIYALYASGAISHGKIGIRKISLVFEILFNTRIGDLHHAFHRMKTRSGSRTIFLDLLKSSLEEYMDKDL